MSAKSFGFSFLLPRKNWMDIIRRDLKDVDITWDEAKELVTDRAESHQRVAQCTHRDAG